MEPATPVRDVSKTSTNERAARLDAHSSDNQFATATGVDSEKFQPSITVFTLKFPHRTGHKAMKKPINVNVLSHDLAASVDTVGTSGGSPRKINRSENSLF